MFEGVIRLLTLAALLFMPFGMAVAPAAAEWKSASARLVAHCDEHQMPIDAPAKMDIHCATCAALPADAPAEFAELRPNHPTMDSAVHALADIPQKIATPPPKLF
jgi:hypothetical protein